MFIGEGYKKRWMQEYAAIHNLTNCLFHTYVRREELPEALSCADVGLVSLMPGQEGLSVPSKTFGIMAAGIPVIGIMSPKSEIALIIQKYNCGFVVEPGDVQGLIDTIIELYKDIDLRIEMGINARATIDSKFNLRNAALKYKSLIESLQ